MQQNSQQYVVTPQFQEIINKISTTNTNILIDGGAGTGKSTLLRAICQYINGNYVVLAPTGIAAVHVGGITIHSFFGLPVHTRIIGCSELKTNRNYNIIKSLHTIIIDEISMVRVDTFNAIDYLLKKHRNNNYPFGGVRMILFGDIFQLPPVTDPVVKMKLHADYGSEYFFSAPCYMNGHFDFYELNTIFRQKDESFQQLLNRVRLARVSNMDLELLNTRTVDKYKLTKPYINCVYISTTNYDINQYNRKCLENISGIKFIYTAQKYGDIKCKTYNIDDVLELKVGSQVMMTRNDSNWRWMNGTIGYISKLSDDEIRVVINNIEYIVEKQQWDIYEYCLNDNNLIQNNLIASVTQYPLTLAWALTIHKCQGQTINNIVINLGNKCFPGQVYVALSRCTALNSLWLERPITANLIQVDKNVISFLYNFIIPYLVKSQKQYS